jgi:hypothetical protein
MKLSCNNWMLHDEGREKDLYFAIDIAGSCVEIREGYVFCCRYCWFMCRD